MSRSIVKNVILGLAVGDALGVPVEFKSRDDLKVRPIQTMKGNGTYHKERGTWSDDTSLTLAGLESLTFGLDFNDVMERYKNWYVNGDYTPDGETFDIGNTTKNAITKYLHQVPPLKCGDSDEMSNGNGSLMRISPFVLYLYFHNYHLDEFDYRGYEIIHKASSLTHSHPRCLLGCGIYAKVLTALLNPFSGNKAAIVQKAIDAALYSYDESMFSSGIKAEISTYEHLVDVLNFSKMSEETIHSTGYIVDTLEAALYCFLNTDSYKDCVLKAVNLGYDTDTTASVAGSLAGAFYGFETIPQEWLNTLVKKEYIISLCNGFEERNSH